MITAYEPVTRDTIVSIGHILWSWDGDRLTRTTYTWRDVSRPEPSMEWTRFIYRVAYDLYGVVDARHTGTDDEPLIAVHYGDQRGELLARPSRLGYYFSHPAVIYRLADAELALRAAS